MITFIFTLLSSFPVHAQYSSCPTLAGTFKCTPKKRSGNEFPPFEIRVQNSVQNSVWSYVIDDPESLHTFVADGQPRPIELRDGKGQYRASCQNNQLFIETTNAQGIKRMDRIFIQRAGFVRVRTGHGIPPTPISCQPTAGTWRLYPH